MKKEDFEKYGTLLHGEQYKTALAEDLNVARRTITRWATGEDIPPNVVNEIKLLIDKKISALQEAKKALT